MNCQTFPAGGLWCDDMRKLIRRLVAEGYQYAVSYEQP